MTRILVISNSYPIPTITGGQQRTNLLMRALQQCGEVDLLLVTNGRGVSEDIARRLKTEYRLVGHVPPTIASQRLPWSVVAPIAKSFVQRIAHNFDDRHHDYDPDPPVSTVARQLVAERRYDLIVGRYLMPLCKAGVFDTVPVIVDVDDVDTEIYRSRLSSPVCKPWERPILGKHVREIGRAISTYTKKCAHMWLASDADRSLLQHPSISVLPNIPYQLPDKPLTPNAGKTIITIAAWNWRPNVVGVDHFLTACWPSIKRAYPDAIYCIVGSGMSETTRARWTAVDGVQVVGRVADVCESYQTASFSVVPVYEGAGTKIKVLESLGHNRVAIATTHACRGFETLFKNDNGLVLAGSDEEMIKACIDHLGQPNRCQELAERGYAHIRQHYSFDRVADEVASTVSRVLGI